MSKTRRGLLTLLALAVLRWPLDVLLNAVLPEAGVDPIPQCIAGVVLSILLLGLPAWLMRPWTSDRLLRTRSILPGVLLAAFSAVLTRAALSPMDAAWQSWLDLIPDALPAPGSIPAALLYIAALAVVPAVMEEAFFRGALLTSLLDGSRRWTAILLTSAAFALMHGSMANLPSLLVLSFMLTLLMLHTGRIAVPAAAHLIYNLTALNWPFVPGWGSGLSGAALLALMVYLCTCQPRYAHQPMKRPDGLIAAATAVVLAAACIV